MWVLRANRMWSYYMDENNEWTFTEFKLGTKPFKYKPYHENPKISMVNGAAI